MKICLYFEAEKAMRTSGIGRALQHQKRALESVGITYTTDPEEDYDLLHINTVGVSSAVTVASARRHGRPVLYHAHSTEEDFRNSFILSNQISPVIRRILINLYSSADEIITPTPYSKSLLEGYGIKLPIHVVSNGIDLNRFNPDPEKMKAFRKYFGLAEGAPVVISVGMYFMRKGIHEFMEIAKRFPEVTFIWFGHTPLISVQTSVRKLIADHPRNVILPGYVKGPIIEGAYASADLFLFPSFEETEGIVVLEALAAKCRVLVRDIGVYDPWLQDGVNCHKAKDQEDFIRLIQAYYAHELSDTTEAGYRTAEERSIPKVGEQLKDIYTALLHQRGKL